MSTTIDNRIAKLSLDNSDFAKKATASIGILAKLLKAFNNRDMNLNGATKSVGTLDKALKDTNTNPLADGVSAIQSRFSALGIIAMTTLQNITNKVVNTAQTMIHQFTAAPIQAGFAMYESKLKAIQVILSNTEGKSNLQDVTKSLGELNDYANKTVYSFEDMTTNMGTFTAAGVDLKTSQVAIQGIGNLAAASGSSTQQAAMAMYQLSQAIAAGKVGLQDWNSVVNAGMGGKKFQSALQANAKAMHKNVDESKSFRESLSDGWLTTDVLMKTLQQFANDKSMLKAATQMKTFSDMMDTVEDELKSGWSNTFELLIGGFKEAPKLWTAVGNTITNSISASAQKRNDLLKSFDDLGGRQYILDGLKTAFESLSKVVEVVQKAFRNVFPPTTGKQITALAKNFKDLMESMKPSSETLSKIGRIATGVFSIFDIGVQAIKGLYKAFTNMIPSGVSSGLLDILANIADVITGFDKGVKAGDALKQSQTALGKALSGVTGIFKNLGNILTNVVATISAIVRAVTSAAVPAAKQLGAAVGKSFKNFDLNQLLGGGILVALGAAIKKFSSFTDSLKGVLSSFKGMFDNMSDAMSNLDALKTTLSSFTKAIKSTTLMIIAASLVAIAVALKMIEGIKAQNIAKGLEVLGISLVGMTKAMSVINKFSGSTASMLASGVVITNIANAILILSMSLKILSTIKPDQLLYSLGALTVTLTELTIAMKAFSKINTKTSVSSLSLMTLSIALVNLSGALKILATIKTTSMIKGLGTIGVMLVEISAFLNTVKGVKFDMSSAAALVVVTTAIYSMTGAIALISKIPVKQIIKGLGTIAIMLGEVAAFSRLVQSKGIVKAAVGIAIMAGAMNAMVPPIQKLGAMNLESLAKGLGTIAIALGEVVLAMKLAKGGLVGAVAIQIMATALNLLVPPIKILGSMNIKALAVALGALAVAFGTVAVAAKVIGVSGAIGLVAFAAAMAGIGLAIGAIGVAMAGFAAAFTALVGATATGIAAFIASLGLLLDGLTGLAPKMVKFGVAVIVSFAEGMAKAIPSLATSGLKIIVGLMTALNNNIGKIIELGLTIVANIIIGLTKGRPKLVKAGVNMILTFINETANTIRDNQDKIVSAVFNVIEAVLEVVVEALGKIIKILFGWIPGVNGAVNKMGKTAKGVLRDAFDIDTVGDEKAKGFVGNISAQNENANAAGVGLATAAKSGTGSVGLSDVGSTKASEFASGLGAGSGTAMDAGAKVNAAAKTGITGDPVAFGQVGIQLGAGTATGLASQQQSANGAGKAVNSAAKTGLSSGSTNSIGQDKGTQFGSGLGSQASLRAATGAGSDLSKKSKKAMEKQDFKSAGNFAAQGFADGLGANTNPISAAFSLGQKAYNALRKALKEHSPSKATAEVGRFFTQGFANGIADDTDKALKSSSTMADKTMEALQSSFGGLQAVVDDNLDLSPTVTPVLDLSAMQMPDLEAYVKGTGRYSDDSKNGQVNNITINATSNDPTKIAREVEKVLVRSVQR